MSPVPTGAVRPVDHGIANETFRRAIVAAGRAPTTDRVQPWRWRVSSGLLDLFIEHGREPTGRRTMISCGAALHHARLTLAAQGWRVTVTRQPDGDTPAHLARLRLDGPAPVSADTTELAGAIRQHPGPPAADGGPIEPAHLRTVVTAFETQHVGLALLSPDQAGALTGEPGAVLAVLHGPQDRNLDWLHAGEALSAGTLVAGGLGVTVEMLGHDPEPLRRTVPELGFPYLVVRLRQDAAGPPATAGLAGDRQG
ncbi:MULTISPECIES: nitroreductase family protein [Catenuloplanes]|uniref:Nitroreductase n=1 Tax=Catenuloplanes niger TaxID=587534 RepID=A0AAE3ZNQ4_9ACTN|nr:hypothetical protein [Catenuloplanes niger]MDR7322606.1 hypothetical protein [Catenuloplanes niger]